MPPPSQLRAPALSAWSLCPAREGNHIHLIEIISCCFLVFELLTIIIALKRDRKKDNRSTKSSCFRTMLQSDSISTEQAMPVMKPSLQSIKGLEKTSKKTSQALQGFCGAAANVLVPAPQTRAAHIFGSSHSKTRAKRAPGPKDSPTLPRGL